MRLTLQKRRLQGQTYEGQTFERLDLSNMLAYGSQWKDCAFIDCDLTLSDMRKARLEDVRFLNCDLHLTDFSGSELRRVAFEICRMKRASFAGIHPIEQTSFEGCQAQYSSFYESTLRDVTFTDTNLHGADLRFMENHKATFSGSNLWGTSIALNCSLFGDGVSFDDRSVNLFLALAARKCQDEEKKRRIEEMIGSAASVVDRLVAAPGSE